MTTITPQMSKLSVKDLLETREKLQADILKLLKDFQEQTGVTVWGVEVESTSFFGFDSSETRQVVYGVKVGFDL